jgi:hypothetical protein
MTLGTPALLQEENEEVMAWVQREVDRVLGTREGRPVRIRLAHLPGFENVQIEPLLSEWEEARDELATARDFMQRLRTQCMDLELRIKNYMMEHNMTEITGEDGAIYSLETKDRKSKPKAKEVLDALARSHNIDTAEVQILQDRLAAAAPVSSDIAFKRQKRKRGPSKSSEAKRLALEAQQQQPSEELINLLQR